MATPTGGGEVGGEEGGLRGVLVVRDNDSGGAGASPASAGAGVGSDGGCDMRRNQL